VVGNERIASSIPEVGGQYALPKTNFHANTIFMLVLELMIFPVCHVLA
jgi:hypothetical protein